jgi:hypothetical protein
MMRHVYLMWYQTLLLLGSPGSSRICQRYRRPRRRSRFDTTMAFRSKNSHQCSQRNPLLARHLVRTGRIWLCAPPSWLRVLMSRLVHKQLLVQDLLLVHWQLLVY